MAEHHSWCELDVCSPCQNIVVVEYMSVTGDVELETDSEVIIFHPFIVLVFENIDGSVFIGES